MRKVDMDATMAKLRVALEACATLPGQDAAELASSRDGIDAQLAFARWSLEQRVRLDANDYVDATGLMLGQMLMGALAPIEQDGMPDAINAVFAQLVDNVNRVLAGDFMEGDATVQAVTVDVGDA